MLIDFEQARLLRMLNDPHNREEGFRMLMKHFGKNLYWHIRRIVVSHDDTEDVFQEMCIKVFDSIGKFRGEADMKIWLYRIATNEAMQHLRRQKRWFQSLDTLSDTLQETLVAETPVDAVAAEVTFQRALLTLPTQQRMVFNLRYYDELSYEDISAITGKNVGTLKTNYHYAVEKIKEYIKKNV